MFFLSTPPIESSEKQRKQTKTTSTLFMGYFGLVFGNSIYKQLTSIDNPFRWIPEFQIIPNQQLLSNYSLNTNLRTFSHKETIRIQTHPSQQL